MTSERNDPSEDKKEKKQKRLIIILIILLLIALLFCGTFVGYIVYNEIGKDEGGGSGIRVETNLDDIEVQKPVEKKPNVVSPGWTELSIPADSLELTSVPFYNPKENEGNYYLRFEVCLLDENGKVSEVLFTTGLIPPGKQVSSVTLNKELSAGTYDAMLHVQPYYMKDKSPTNNMATRLTLIVK